MAVIGSPEHYGSIGSAVSGWNDTRAAYPADKTIPELFAIWADRAPHAVAVRGGGQDVTYADVDRWSNQLAKDLVDAGVRVGEPVGLLGSRCPQAPIAELAILKAGGVYVPLDPEDPPARRRLLVAELGIERLVSLPGFASDLAGVAEVAMTAPRPLADPGPPRVEVRATDPAYILFTSGATGAPKAVAVAHRSVVRLVVNTGYVSFGPGDRVAATGYLAFDASVFEVWGALLNGACLVVVDPGTLLDAGEMERLLVRERISVLWLSAGVFHHLALARPGMFSTVRFLISGGDVLAPAVVRQVLRAGPPEFLVNGYGPTENTTFSTTYRITQVPAEQARIPIGRPITNSTAYVVTDEGTPARVGQEGELWVGGDGVALGYVNDAELTRLRFVDDRFGDGERLFRTGDRARWLPEGVLEFLGRRDRMVKVRGFRIELDEVEAALRACPGVADAAVIVAPAATGSVIEAFYTPAAGLGPAADPAVLRTWLGTRLPAFMLPGRFVRMDDLPLSAAGKIDRLRLVVAGRTPMSDGVARPATPAAGPTEVGLARIWEEVLRVEHVRPDDDFFDLGGNSLLAATVFARLRTLFGIDPRQGRFLTRRLLADPSLSGCALAVQEARDGTLTSDDAGGDIDLWQAAAEVDLPLPAARAGGAAPVPVEVLLTGGSGFLGTYLLRELLHRTDARIHCLVRAGDDDRAYRRLADSLHRYGLGDLPAGRVVAVAGDLGRPALGWDEDRFDRYARSLDLILHAGAYVNFTYPYRHLAPVTVGGTAELIRMAARHRGVPVHFVSSLAVIAGFGAAGVRFVGEDTPLDFPEHLYMGYTETKWVAEQVLARARAAGLPVAVHRPYEISGDRRGGAWNLESATCAMFKVIVDAGCAPLIDLALDLVPVDTLAAQIVHIATARAVVSNTYHLANPRPGTLRDMVARLREQGYPIDDVPFDDWVGRVVRFACDHPEHPFTPFIPLWVDRCPRNGLILKEMFFARYFPEFGRTHADAALADAGIEVPPVDAALLDHYIAFLRRAGFLPAPVGR